MSESTLFPQLNDEDWNEVFNYAGNVTMQGQGTVTRSDIDDTTPLTPFHREHVASILAMSAGDNDGPPWLIAGHLTDGRWFFIEAGCDYTGWDCQAGGTALVAPTEAELVRYCITSEFRERLGIEMKS